MRLALATVVGLGIDESYVVAAGRVPQLGYFDHPPAVWWLSWAAAQLAGSEAPVVVRAPFVALFAVSTWLMFRLTARLYSARAGLWAAVALNLAPVFGVTTGGWVLPDGPLTCALLGAACCLVRAIEAERPAWGWWLAAGVCVGLALLSKYTAVLTVVGAFVFFLTSRDHRSWLARPQPYAALALAGVAFSPVLIWNAQHGWVSFAFQGGRAMAAGWHPFAPFTVLGGEALYLLPWLWVPLMLCWGRAVAAGPTEWRGWFLAMLATPPIILFPLVALWSTGRVLPHWAMPGYLFVFPLLGEAIARRLSDGARWLRLAIGATAAFVAIALVIVATEARWLFPPLPPRVTQPGADLEGADWTSLREEFARRSLAGLVVGAPRWRDAGKVDYGLGGSQPVIVLDADARQFGFVHPRSDFIGQDVLIVAPRGEARKMAVEFAPLFASIVPLPAATIAYPARPPAELPLFLGHDLRRWPPP